MQRWMAVCVLGLVCFAGNFSEAQTPEVTASEVVDKASLQAFVEGTEKRMRELVEGQELRTPFLARLKKEGDWKHGNTYIVLLGFDGVVIHHSHDEEAVGKNLLDLQDDQGNLVVQEMMAAGAAGGGHVDYFWDDPTQTADADSTKTAYAIEFRGVPYGLPMTIIGGFYMDLSMVPDPVIDFSLFAEPEVTAADVKDRESLKAFVLATIQVYFQAVQEHGLEVVRDFMNVLRAEEGPFRHGSVYLFMFDTNGYVLFHGVSRALEDQVVLNVEDSNGLKFVQELIKAAQRDGGGFVEYYFDDPSIEGDEDTGSPKVSYVELIVAHEADLEFVAGAGIYLDSPTAVDRRSWGQIKNSTR